MAMSEEQQEKLAKIEEAGGKELTPAQKAVMVKFATIDIKANKPKDSMSVDVPAGPKVVPKKRKLPTMQDEK
tara:strand:+ start:2735 stop:2950 length:216 start_codon:yes stop_codon:yes gene_type:complete